jgi:hypothetical protein
VHYLADRHPAFCAPELVRIRNAPPPSDEIKIAVIEQIKTMANEGRPHPTVDGGKVSLHWPDTQEHGVAGQGLSAPSSSAHKLLAWLFRGMLTKKAAGTQVEDHDGIASSERPRLLAEVEQRTFGLEVVEEQLVVTALEGRERGEPEGRRVVSGSK